MNLKLLSSTAKHAATMVTTAGLLLAASSTLALPQSGKEHAADDARMKLLDLRVGRNAQGARLVFDVSNLGPYKLLALDNPPRMVIDFPNSPERHFDHSKIPLRGTPIAGIRTGVQTDGTLRYVFDLREHATAKLFPLKADQGRGQRLVLDLFSVQVADAEPAIVEPPIQSATDIAAAPPADSQIARGTGLSGGLEGEHLEDKILDTKPLAASPASITTQPAEPKSMAGTPTPIDTTGHAASSPAQVAANHARGAWSGSIGVQARAFLNDPIYTEQEHNALSIAFEPEYYRDTANGSQRIAFRGFARADATDSERTHADLRELYWQIEKERLSFKAGMDVVFWGVTESQHLVDIINQTDLVENPDGEDKLGQPMINVDYFSDYGTWQAYVLPYFRERTFPGEEGRLRMDPPVETSDPLWDSNDEEKHIDFALRWSHFLGDWDVGVAHFSGTERDPVFVYEQQGQNDLLRPLYLQVDQTSVDLQATKGAWLWKAEAIYNQNKMEDYFASVSGFEHTQFGFEGSSLDLGLLLEYHYDERGDDAPTALQNDLYTGLRLTGNDIASTQFLAGITVDLDNRTSFGNIEAMRRLGESWTITLQARTFFNVREDDPVYFLRDDDYLELQLDRFF